MQINLRNSMGSKVHFVNPILSRGSQGHRVTAKGFADAKLTVAERDLPVTLHLAHLVPGSILQRRQLLRKRSLTWLIAARRHGHRQRFMRPQVIVTVAPFVKTKLHPLKVSKHSLGQHLDFQTAVKAFVFALGLRMIRPTVTDGNTEPQQPNRQRRVLMRPVISPGRTVVHQHSLRQAITAKSSSQLGLHGAGLLIAAGLQAQRVTRVIVEHGQRMTALAIAQAKVTLKIHLPELVRSLLCESLIGTAHLIGRAGHAIMTPQDRMHRALGQGALPNSLETRFDLASAPAILIANHQYSLLDGWLASSRRVMWSPRAIGQAGSAALSVS